MFVVYGFRIANMFQAPSGHWANKVLHEADEQSSLFNTTTFRKQGIEILYRHFGGVPWEYGSERSMLLLFLKGIDFKEGCQQSKKSDEMLAKSCMSPMPKFFLHKQSKKTVFSDKPSLRR